MEQFTASSAGINKDIAAGSHMHTSFDPEKRAIQETEGFKAEVQSIYDELSESAKSEKQKQYLNEQMSVFQSNYAHKYNDYLSTKGRTFSVMITGASGFNNRAHDKTNKAEQNRYEDLQEFKHRAFAAILREIKKMAVEEAGGELAVMQKKIESAEKCHEVMVISNRIIKKKGATQEEKVKTIMDATGVSEEMATKMFKPDYMGNIGFPGWSLQNSNANIRRMKERITEMQAKEATPTSDITFAGGSIVDNAEADRVQIHFDAIPDEAMRSKLKGEGWRWSPFNTAWQRKRTPAAMQSAKRITGAV
jgi:hypothetical protein